MSLVRVDWLLRWLHIAPCSPATCPVSQCRHLPWFGSGLRPSHLRAGDAKVRGYIVKKHLDKQIETEKCNVRQVGTSCLNTWGQTGIGEKVLNKARWSQQVCFQGVLEGNTYGRGQKRGDEQCWDKASILLGRKKRKNLKMSLGKKWCNLQKSGWMGSGMENGSRMNNKGNR